MITGIIIGIVLVKLSEDYVLVSRKRYKELVKKKIKNEE